MGDELLAVDVIAVRDDLLILQTTWAPADRLRFGRRQTRTEQIRDQTTLMSRLTELAGAIFAPIGAEVVTPVANPDDSLPAAA